MAQTQYLMAIDGWLPYIAIEKILLKEKKIDMITSSCAIPTDIIEKQDRVCLLYVHFTKPYKIKDNILKHNPEFLKCKNTLQDNFWLVNPLLKVQGKKITGGRFPILAKGKLFEVSNILEIRFDKKDLKIFEDYETKT